MDKRRFNGGHSTKGFAGRPKKSEEMALIEKLNPLQDEGLKQLKEGIERGEFRYVQLFFQYYYGKPTERREVNISQEQPIFNFEY